MNRLLDYSVYNTWERAGNMKLKIGAVLMVSALSVLAAPRVDTLVREANKESGYREVFKKDLSNAIFTEKLWDLKEGVLWATPERLGESHHSAEEHPKPKYPQEIWTKETYSDFILDFEVKCAEDTNSGVFIRCGDVKQWIHTCIEMQILQGEDENPRKGNGAIYECKAPDKDASLNPAGEWTRMTIIADDNWLYVLREGKLVNSMNLDKWTTARKNPDGTKNKFRTAYADMPREGNIGFQYHGQPIWFRNVRIKEI